MRRCLAIVCSVTTVALAGASPGVLASAGPGPAQAAPGGSNATAGSPATAAAAAPITAREAAPFLGDWTLPVTTTSGTYVGFITLKVEDNTVVALLSADVVPEQRTTDIIKAGKGLTITAKMDYEGVLVEKPIPVSVAVTLTPAGDYINVGIDFRINNKSFFITSTAKRVAS